jgi:hypothetical protein
MGDKLFKYLENIHNFVLEPNDSGHLSFLGASKARKRISTRGDPAERDVVWTSAASTFHGLLGLAEIDATSSATFRKLD